MSLIEQAAKRLDELRKSGVDVADALVDEDNQPDGSLGPAAARTAGRISAPERPVQPHVPPAAAAPPKRADAPAVSRAVRVDLGRLAAGGFITPDALRTQLAAEFRTIKRPLLANAQPAGPSGPRNTNLVMVTSAVAGEGKSFVALNLALSMAMELDTTVLLVDADVAKPVMLEILGLPSSKGLMDVLTDPKVKLSDAILRTDIERLALLPAGAPHARATELLASEAMTRLLHEMSARYADRIIVFDSPPLLQTTESPALATHMGQIVIVVEAERTAESAMTQALAKVEKCPIVMTLLNKARAPRLGPYYGYGYGYAAEQGAAKDGE